MSGKMPNPRHFLRVFAVELIIYSALLVGFYYIVKRYLEQPLVSLFGRDLVIYGVVTLVLLFFQGGVFDWITSLIVRLLGIEHYE
jgi:hypothetical protein